MSLTPEQSFDIELRSAAFQNDVPRILDCVDRYSELDKSGDLLESMIDSVVKPETFEALLDQGWSVESRRSQADKPILCCVADKGRNDLLDVLIRRGADVNATDQNGHTAAKAACSEKSKAHEECLRLLIAAGADLNVGRVFSPLTLAVEESTETVVNMLLDAGADVNRWYRRGNPLSAAIEYNRVKHVSRLLAAGANPNLPIPPEADLLFEELGSLTLLEMAKKLKRSKILPLLQGQPAISVAPPTISELWNSIEKTLTDAAEDLNEIFLPGADTAKLAEFEAQIGAKLPRDIAESWKIHDGQPVAIGLFRLNDDSTAFLDGDASLFRLLAVHEWSAESSRMREVNKHPGHPPCLCPCGRFCILASALSSGRWSCSRTLWEI